MPAAVLIASTAHAQGPWSATLIDSNLRSRDVSLVGLDGREVEYVDDLGRVRRAPVDSLIALLPITRGQFSNSRGEEGMVELVDGQRLPGRLVPTAGGGEAIIWEHDAFGEIEIALEDIAVVSKNRAAHEALRGGERIEDELLLVNGDRLSGFVIELGSPVEIETSDGILRIEQERVAGAALSNPGKPQKGMIVWLADGTVAAVDSALTDASGVVSLSLKGGQSAQYEVRWLDGLAFESGGIVALRSLDPVAESSLDERLYNWGIERDEEGSWRDAALRAGDIVLRGPTEVIYELPEGTRRISGRAVLPEVIGEWADCLVSIDVDGAPVWQARLDSTNPGESFNADISGEELRVRVEAGKYGPVWSTAILERAMLAVDP